MTTNPLLNVSRTISDELEKAVTASLVAQDEAVNAVTTEITSAFTEYTNALAEVEAMEREAADLVSRALKARRAAQSRYAERMSASMRLVEGLQSGVENRPAIGRY
jgi:uncharacterized protein YqeY